MLNHIPTHLIGGPLGAGKTSLIRQLLAQRPAHERWAVLVNEFGQIGLDAALLASDADGVALGEVAGGCLCCVNGVPFQVGLGRLLRKARPQRLLIEPSGLGHPLQLLAQLRQPPWAGVLAVQPALLVLDAAALAAGQPLADSQQAALAAAGLLLLNKAEGLDEKARARVLARLPQRPLRWTSQAVLPLADLPGYAGSVAAGIELPDVPGSSAPLPSIRPAVDAPICRTQVGPEGWSIGWTWHSSQRFVRQRVQQWLETLPWRRAKLVLHTDAGWLSANALDGRPLHWQASAWRQDSRLELIFAEAQDAVALSSTFGRCRLT
ncbi:CobW-like GTP-binding protein [Pseudomonas benzenivorans]|uniref:CobW-like GTP-binding protein n=1 Tax=Pseudomonas benzenivorans TaxID=556533 RepID=A0ABZ0PVP8_9PSED|nr:CobW-like GTP-binding protein [Pseudomonas benzenivorans]WPC05191.1 CobW-like GTP-binding protein [Pseudomonas benzenivorans]